MDWIYLALIGLASGILGSLGVGGGGILIVFMSLIFSTPQIAAQGINLLFFIPIAVLSILIYCKKGLIKPRPVIFTAVFGLAGALVGVVLSGMIGDGILRKIFGALLILVSIKELFCAKKAE